MSAATDRTSPSGPVSSLKGTIALAAVAIAANASATGTATFSGALTSDQVGVSPFTALGAGILLSHARVVTTDTIEVTLGNVTTAAVTAAAATYNVQVRQ